MSDNNDCVLPKLCVPPEESPKEVNPPATEAFSFCAGNKVVQWDGTRLTWQPRTNTLVDGTYGKISIIDGCIVGGDDCEYPTYSPAYCNDNPSPCQEGGENSGGGVSVSSAANNSIINTSLGLFAKTYIRGESGVTIRGEGTVTNPYIVSKSEDTGGSSSGSVMARDSSVKVVEENGITKIGLPTQSIEPGTYNGLVVNKHGVITGRDDALTGDTITDIKEGEGISVAKESESGVAIVSHVKSPVGSKTYTVDNYRIKLDHGGNIIGMEQIETEDTPKALLATHQIIMFPPVPRNPETGDGGMVSGGWVINSWGNPISNADVSATQSGGATQLLVPIPNTNGDYVVETSAPYDYPWIDSVQVRNEGIVIVYDALQERTSASYINISVKEA